MDKPLANTNSQDSSRPGLGGSHHLPPNSIMLGHRTSIQMSFCPRTPKWDFHDFERP